MSTSEKAPEGKVWASTVGGTAGLTVSVFVLWLLGITVWHKSMSAEEATAAVSSVPAPVSAFIGLLITVGGVFIGGYMARHTPRFSEIIQTLELQNAEQELNDDDYLFVDEPGPSENQEPDPDFDEPDSEEDVEVDSEVPVVDQDVDQDVDNDGHDDATGRFVSKD